MTTTVQCLLCGARYGKPDAGKTLATNPGCPRCGYLGWVPVSEANDAPPAPIRLARKR